jgi:hypothetical protein
MDKNTTFTQIKNIIQQLKEIQEALQKPKQDRYYIIGDRKADNFCVLDDKIYLIDFGSIKFSKKFRTLDIISEIRDDIAKASKKMGKKNESEELLIFETNKRKRNEGETKTINQKEKKKNSKKIKLNNEKKIEPEKILISALVESQHGVPKDITKFEINPNSNYPKNIAGSPERKVEGDNSDEEFNSTKTEKKIKPIIIENFENDENVKVSCFKTPEVKKQKTISKKIIPIEVKIKNEIIASVHNKRCCCGCLQQNRGQSKLVGGLCKKCLGYVNGINSTLKKFGSKEMEDKEKIKCAMLFARYRGRLDNFIINKIKKK